MEKPDAKRSKSSSSSLSQSHSPSITQPKPKRRKSSSPTLSQSQEPSIKQQITLYKQRLEAYRTKHFLVDYSNYPTILNDDLIPILQSFLPSPIDSIDNEIKQFFLKSLLMYTLVNEPSSLHDRNQVIYNSSSTDLAKGY